MSEHGAGPVSVREESSMAVRESVGKALDWVTKLILTTTEALDSRAKLLALLLLVAIFWSGHHSAGRYQFKEDGHRVMDTRTGDQYRVDCSYAAPSKGDFDPTQYGATAVVPAQSGVQPKGDIFDAVAAGGKPITVDESEVTPAPSKLTCTTQKVASIN